MHLTTIDVPKAPVQLYKCHAGEVVDLATSPFNHYLVSLGRDGRLFLYDYIKRQLVFYYEFLAKGCCMIWVPTEVLVNICFSTYS